MCCIYPQITTRNSAPSVRKTLPSTIDVKLCAENVSQFIFSSWRALQPDSDASANADSDPDPEPDPDATRFDLVMLADAGRLMAAMVTLKWTTALFLSPLLLFAVLVTRKYILHFISSFPAVTALQGVPLSPSIARAICQSLPSLSLSHLLCLCGILFMFRLVQHCGMRLFSCCCCCFCCCPTSLLPLPGGNLVLST